MSEIGTMLGSLAGSGLWITAALCAVLVYVIWRSLWTIGPTQVGLVRKRLSFNKLKDGNPVAFHGEAGYQAELLMPGLRFKLWLFFVVTRHPMVQIPAGQIGVVIAQVGAELPVGAKSATYNASFDNFQDLRPNTIFSFLFCFLLLIAVAL